MNGRTINRALLSVALATTLAASLVSCGGVEKRKIEVTAYCACSKCTDWERGSWRYLKLDFWNRYVSKGPRKGKPYSGKTASGTYPREPHPGLFSWSSLTRPWKLPFRILFPWLWLAHDGTIAADTRYYPFGTRMYVPGYGYGRVEDRGGAIKGPKRLDLYYDSHRAARRWGRKTIEVEILD
jgi:hypothetical protein